MPCNLADSYWAGRTGSITVDTNALSNLFGLNQIINLCQNNTAPDDIYNNLMAQARAVNQNFYGEYDTIKAAPWPQKMIRDYQTIDKFRFFIARYKSAFVPGIPVENCNFENRKYNLRFAPRCEFYYDQHTSMLCSEAKGRCVNSSVRATLKRPNLCHIHVRGTEMSKEGFATIYANSEIDLVSLNSPYACFGCLAHKGFWKQAFRFWQEYLKKDADEFKCKNFVMSGHSLGAAVGSLIAWQAQIDYPGADVTSYGWESPRFLNKQFSVEFNKRIPSLRTTHQVYFDETDDIHSIDIVVQIPLWVSSWLGRKYYFHTGWEIMFRDPRNDGQPRDPACCGMICDSVSVREKTYDVNCRCSRFYGGDTVYFKDIIYWSENIARINFLHGDFDNTEIQANIRADAQCPFRALPPDDSATNFCYVSHWSNETCESNQVVSSICDMNMTAISKITGCVLANQCGIRVGEEECVAFPLRSVQWLRGEPFCTCEAVSLS
jgi:hypothetical protein